MSSASAAAGGQPGVARQAALAGAPAPGRLDHLAAGHAASPVAERHEAPRGGHAARDGAVGQREAELPAHSTSIATTSDVTLTCAATWVGWHEDATAASDGRPR